MAKSVHIFFVNRCIKPYLERVAKGEATDIEASQYAAILKLVLDMHMHTLFEYGDEQGNKRKEYKSMDIKNPLVEEAKKAKIDDATKEKLVRKIIGMFADEGLSVKAAKTVLSDADWEIDFYASVSRIE